MIQFAFAHPYLFAFCGTIIVCVIAVASVDLTANLVKGVLLLASHKKAKSGNPSMTHKEMAEFLFGLLDDIDTASDMAKGDNDGYRKLVEKLQARRYETGITSDGQRLIFPEQR